MRNKLTSQFPDTVYLLLAMVFLVGCESTNTKQTTKTEPETQQVLLRFTCTEEAFTKSLMERVGGWAGKSAVVAFTEDPSEADFAVVSGVELAKLAEANELLPLPNTLRASDHPLQRNRIIEAYRDTLVNWDGVTLGLPLRGDGFVLVYRANRFSDAQATNAYRRKTGRSLLPPRTWEDLAEVAEFFSELDGKPSLPPLPTADRELITRFLQIAACYDRQAQKESATTTDLRQGLSFTFDLESGQPRLMAPAFVAAATILQRLNKQTRSEPVDPIAAMEAGAVVAVLDLRAVARLPRDAASGAVHAHYSLAPLPGTAGFFSPDGTFVKVASEGNYVPYFGPTALFGVVLQRTKHPEVVWNVLANAASSTGSIGLLGDPTVGSGPFRREHLDDAREGIWLGYRFDAANSRKLAQAMRSFAALEVLNPIAQLRLPNEAEFNQPLVASLKQSIRGVLAPETAMLYVNQAWLAKLDQAPEAKRLAPLYRSLGIK